MKPGYQTTEFWVTIVTGVIGILVSLGYIGADAADPLIKVAGMIIAAIVAAAYSASRAKVKAGR